MIINNEEVEPVAIDETFTLHMTDCDLWALRLLVDANWKGCPHREVDIFASMVSIKHPLLLHVWRERRLSRRRDDD